MGYVQLLSVTFTAPFYADLLDFLHENMCLGTVSFLNKKKFLTGTHVKTYYFEISLQFTETEISEII